MTFQGIFCQFGLATRITKEQTKSVKLAPFDRICMPTFSMLKFKYENYSRKKRVHMIQDYSTLPCNLYDKFIKKHSKSHETIPLKGISDIFR
jgi:hypothetical protein